jgi:thioesterase domain-containing protein
VVHGYGGDVFCYTDFARALSPRRPVFGLQARGVDGSCERHWSVEEMAEHYATLIEQHWPEGVVHLLGQSAGGWYVWAVATELLRRGRRLGLVVILDSGPSAAIAPRLRASLLARRIVRRVPVYAHRLLHSKHPRSFLAFLREHRRSLVSQLRRFQPDVYRLKPQHQQPSRSVEHEQDHFDLLHRRYQPAPLPLRAHLLTSRHDPQLKRRLWRALACKGVVFRQLFQEHHHFHDPSLAAELAAEIDQLFEAEGF